jgi:phage repressor protein C with HTH and peptisase S24 domain
MSKLDGRAELQRLISERREDYAALSRLIGRNPAYIQQFIKRGTPRRLDEKDRKILAAYFGVSEELLGGFGAAIADEMIRVPRLDVGASAGFGSTAGHETLIGHIAFEPNWLRQLSRAAPSDLSSIRVQGDSMNPTLSDGDDILVDQSDRTERLRDGIYVLRQEEALMVKRLAVNPSTRRVTIKSDNSAYPEWPDCELSTLDIIGRVIWAGRRFS